MRINMVMSQDYLIFPNLLQVFLLDILGTITLNIPVNSFSLAQMHMPSKRDKPN